MRLRQLALVAFAVSLALVAGLLAYSVVSPRPTPAVSISTPTPTVASVTPTPTKHAIIALQTPTRGMVTPTVHVVYHPTVTPQATPTAPKRTPTPTATPTACSTLYCNPWGYNLKCCVEVTHPPSTFCSYFPCVANFWQGSGFVAKCANQKFSFDVMPAGQGCNNNFAGVLYSP